MIDLLRPGADRIAALCFAGMIGIGPPEVASAAVINRGVEGPPLSEIRPAPKSIYPTSKLLLPSRHRRRLTQLFSDPSF
jgi:hypothetical protein